MTPKFKWNCATQSLHWKSKEQDVIFACNLFASISLKKNCWTRTKSFLGNKSTNPTTLLLKLSKGLFTRDPTLDYKISFFLPLLCTLDGNAKWLQCFDNLGITQSPMELCKFLNSRRIQQQKEMMTNVGAFFLGMFPMCSHDVPIRFQNLFPGGSVPCSKIIGDGANQMAPLKKNQILNCGGTPLTN